MKLSERVQYVVDNLPISASAWSLKAGKSRGYAQKLLERDAVRPDVAALRKMAEVVGVPRAWFVDGEGDPPLLGAEAPTRPETRVERDPAPHLDTSHLSTPLERAIGHAFDPTRHDWTDGQDVLQALRRDIHGHDRPEVDLIEAARRWLDAAHALRREGKPVTASSLLDRITFGKGPLRPAERDEASEAMQREMVEHAAREGVTFGEGAAAIEAFRQQGKKGGGA